MRKIVDTILPTTMVGSYPRPDWFTYQLSGRDARVAFKHAPHEEAYADATRVIIQDQEEAGLDIVCDGQMYFDDYIGSIGSFCWYMYERIPGFDPAKEEHPAAVDAATMTKEIMLLCAPNANSYRRLRPLSYAPLAATWGHDNRTVALRVPSGPEAARRIEHRLAGADASPYLVLAAVLAGIHHGLCKRLEPGPPTRGNAYAGAEPDLPASWERAQAALASATVLPDYLGEAFCRLYGACRAAERARFEDVVTPLEHSWYLRAV